MGYEYELLQSLTKYLDIDLKIKVISGIEQSIDLLNRGEGDLIAFPSQLPRSVPNTFPLPTPNSIPTRYWFKRNLPIGEGCLQPE